MLSRIPAPVLATAVLVALAAPAAAQGVSCGGLGEGATWLGGARESSDIATAPAPLALSGVSVAPGTRSVALFTLSQPMVVRLEAAPADAFGDTVLELFDAQGRLVVTDDDSGGGLSSRAETDLAPGDYCLAATGYAGSGVTADLQVSRTEMAALTEGLSGGFVGTDGFPLFVGVQPCLADTPATQLGQGPIDGQLGQGISTINTVTSTPYYRFTLASRQVLTIRAENPAADPYIYLFDGQGRLLAENDDYDSLNSRIDVTDPLEPGSYCIAMRSLSDPDQPVTIRVSGYDAGQVALESYAAGEAAPPLDGSYPITTLGPLPAQLSRDVSVPGTQAQWFMGEVGEDGVLFITADEVRDADPVLSVFDEFGRMIGMNDDANGTLNSELMVRTPPGRYLIAVRQYSQNYQGTIRIGIRRFVPAQ